jgi:ACS family tartrate transporter-like MFS transporter
LFAGWNSDRTQERRWHTLLPLLLGAVAFALAPATRGHMSLTIACFMLAFTGIKSYQPSFWSLPSLFLTDAAAAGSIGLINSLGNLGGFAGPSILGKVETVTGSFVGGMCFLSGSLALTAVIIFVLGLGRRKAAS